MEACRPLGDDELDRLAASVEERPARDLLRRLVATVRAARHAQLMAERRCHRQEASLAADPAAEVAK